MSANGYYRRQLAVNAAFGRLGFSPEEMFVSYNGGRPCSILVSQGRTFAVNFDDMAPLAVDEDTYNTGWEAAVAVWNKLDQAARDKMYRASVSYPVLLSLTLALKGAGFSIRNLGETRSAACAN